MVFLGLWHRRPLRFAAVGSSLKCRMGLVFVECGKERQNACGKQADPWAYRYGLATAFRRVSSNTHCYSCLIWSRVLSQEDLAVLLYFTSCGITATWFVMVSCFDWHEDLLDSWWLSKSCQVKLKQASKQRLRSSASRRETRVVGLMQKL